ncbi:SH3 domain-containing protein [Hyphomicrobium sp.]|uniref:SH3 domain-containing protein n=1 Tax=Hyphomicrobium sp. TaxID=82 RepID=UPI003F730983
MLRPFIVISLLSGATAAFAEPVPLGGDGLKALSGSLVELDTPLGTKLPIQFGSDGLVSAEAGDLAPILGSKKDRGRWWVEGDRLCSKWFRWFDAEVRCITVSRDGSRLYWKKDDGETGTATLVEALKPDKPSPKPDVVQQVAALPKESSKATAARAAPIETAPVHATPVSVSTAASADVASPSATASGDDGIPDPVRKQVFETAAVHSPPPIVEARADVTVPVAEFAAEPIMRFGGAGLLEASARVGLERGTVPDAANEPTAVAKAASRTVPATEAAVNVAMTPATVEKPAPAQKRSLAAADKTPALSLPKARPAAPRQAAAPRAQATRDVPLYKVRGVEDNDVLNIRRGPSEEQALVATIPATGRRLEVTGQCQKDWCPIRYGSARGWVHSYYLVEENPRQASSSAVYLAKP